MNFLDQLDSIIQNKHMLDHPFYMKWSKGELTKEQLQAYAKDYYLHIKAFPKYLSAIHSRCDDLKARKLLLDNLMDEEHGYPNHIDLWKQFVFALGVSPEELEAHEPSEAAKAKVATFMRWCTGDSLAAGVAALYSYESQIPCVAKEKIRGLKEFFGFSQPEDYAYFTEHEEADVRHASEERALIAMLSKDDSEQVLEASREVTHSLYGFLDSFLEPAACCHCHKPTCC